MKTLNLYYEDNHTKRYLAGEVLTNFVDDCSKWSVHHEAGCFIFYGEESELKKLLQCMNFVLGEARSKQFVYPPTEFQTYNVMKDDVLIENGYDKSDELWLQTLYILTSQYENLWRDVFYEMSENHWHLCMDMSKSIKSRIDQGELSVEMLFQILQFTLPVGRNPTPSLQVRSLRKRVGHTKKEIESIISLLFVAISCLNVENDGQFKDYKLGMDLISQWQKIVWRKVK